MEHLVVKMTVIESESGWGRKVDDYMVCLNVEDGLAYQKEFNARNTADTAPDWYMQVEGEPIPFDITNKQYKALNKKDGNRMWLSQLDKI